MSNENSAKRILVLAVHPDDETLGCGGTLLRHAADGDELFWVIGTCIPDDSCLRHKIEKRKQQIPAVASAYPFKDIVQLDVPTLTADQVPMVTLVAKLQEVFEKIKPHVVYLPFRHDIHSDHQCFFDAAMSACKTFRAPYIETIMMMETLSETNFALPFPETTFVPNTFVDITPYLEKKLEICRIYDDEILAHPFPRSEESIKALAVLRGSMAGVSYAESFMVIKDIR